MSVAGTEQSNDGQTLARLRQLSRPHQIEVLTVVLLSLASFVATWSGFQGSRWNAGQTERYSQASAARTESTKLALLANQLESIDLETFNVYAVAVANGNTALADFHARRFRPDFQAAFDAWMALDPLTNPNAPPSPFLMPDYRLPELVMSETKSEEAATLFEQGTNAAANADAYILTTVFLAIVLFFLGVSARIDLLPARLVMIGVGAAMLAFSIVRVLLLPRA